MSVVFSNMMSSGVLPKGELFRTDVASRCIMRKQDLAGSFGGRFLPGNGERSVIQGIGGFVCATVGNKSSARRRSVQPIIIRHRWLVFMTVNQHRKRPQEQLDISQV